MEDLSKPESPPTTPEEEEQLSLEEQIHAATERVEAAIARGHAQFPRRAHVNLQAMNLDWLARPWPIYSLDEVAMESMDEASTSGSDASDASASNTILGSDAPDMDVPPLYIIHAIHDAIEAELLTEEVMLDVSSEDDL